MEKVVYDILTKKIFNYGKEPWSNADTFVNHAIAEVERAELPEGATKYPVLTVCKFDIVTQKIYMDKEETDKIDAQRAASQVIQEVIVNNAKELAISEGKLDAQGNVKEELI